MLKGCEMSFWVFEDLEVLGSGCDGVLKEGVEDSVVVGVEVNLGGFLMIV